MFRALNLPRRVSLLSTLTSIPPSPPPTNHLRPNLLLLRTLCSSTSSSTPSSISDAEFRKYVGYFFLLLGCGAATYYSFPFTEDAKHKKAVPFRYAPLPDDLHTVSNWSGTHEVQTRVFLQPENLEELEKIVTDAHEKRQKIRPVGSGLSPNGIGLQRAGMVNLALMDKVLEVDKEKKQVRVQAGIRVSQLIDGIKEHGLALQNVASIREQQVGGIVQVLHSVSAASCCLFSCSHLPLKWKRFGSKSLFGTEFGHCWKHFVARGAEKGYSQSVCKLSLGISSLITSWNRDQ